MGVFDYNLGNDWKVNSKVKVSEYVNDFGLYVAANGTVNAPASLSDYLAKYGYAGATNINASYMGGTALGANDRIIDNLNVDRHRPISDLTGELSVTKKNNG